MDFIQRLAGAPKQSVDLEDLCHHAGYQVDTKPLPDDLFEKISKAMLEAGLPTNWSVRPRTYFILSQLRRRELMNLFVLSDLDDGCIPYANRGLLPRGNPTYQFNPLEAEDFLQWQTVCESAALSLERGISSNFANGDLLFIKEKQLGQGSSGNSVVDKVVSKATGKVYARKKIRRDKYPTDAQRTYKRELHALTKVGEHVHLIKVRASYSDKKYFGLLLQPVAEENLKTYLLRVSASEPDVRSHLCSLYGCMANVVAFLHGAMILHKDIKLDNFLLSKGRLILTDFGTSFDWSKTGQSMTLSNEADARTPRYASPEVAKESRFHRASDIWSLGVVFLEIATVLRGQTLAQLQKFLVGENAKTAHFYANLVAVHRWSQKLAEQSGPAIDNEPLAWSKRMLDPVMENRPTASDLYDSIVTSQMGRFCGSCCASCEESEASSLSDLLESDQEQELHNHRQKWPPRAASPANSVPGAFPVEAPLALSISHYRDPSMQSNHGAVYTSYARSSSQKQPQAGTIAAQHVKTQSLAVHRGMDGSTPPVVAPDIRHKDSAMAKKDSTAPAVRGIFGWFSGVRGNKPKPVMEPKQSTATVDTQRMNHFLATLPAAPQDYEVVPNQSQISLVRDHQLVVRPVSPVNSPIARTVPIRDENTNTVVKEKQSVAANSAVTSMLTRPVHFDKESERHDFDTEFTSEKNKRRNSWTAPQPRSSSPTHNEEEQDLPTLRMLRVNSDSDLRMIGASDTQNFEHTIADLRATEFGRLSQDDSSKLSPSHPVQEDRGKQQSNAITPESRLIEANLLTMSNVMKSVQPDATQSLVDSRTAVAENEVDTKAEPSKPSKSSETRKVAFDETVSQRHVSGITHRALASLGNQNTPRRRQWESASILMSRILNEQASIAGTSEASARTRNLMKQSPSVLSWNDRTYRYLPYFVQEGKVPAVRVLLNSGCNPGTKQKRRWKPMYLAVKGRTHKHNKCLLELLRAGADVDARDKQGRTYLQHAISQAPWPGYSTTIYLLLSFKANPNLVDDRGIAPFVQLLLGSGPLAQEERNALLLMLAPNFDARVDRVETSLEDNVLHLAIRRKDPYALDAVLDKISTDPCKSALLAQKNASGFTPVMLVMSSFTFRDKDDSEIGLRLLELLLKAGASANDKDKTSGNGPLHLAVGTYRNVDLLDLLLEYDANPTLKNLEQITPATLLVDKKDTDSTDSWSSSLFQRFKDDSKWYSQSRNVQV